MIADVDSGFVKFVRKPTTSSVLCRARIWSTDMNSKADRMLDCGEGHGPNLGRELTIRDDS